MRINDFTKRRGQSLVEVLIAIAIAALVVGSGVGALIVTLKSNLQNRNTQVASTLGQELLDNVRSVAGGNWGQIYNISPKGSGNNYYLTPSKDLSGTVAVTNGSSIVTGTGTTFTTDLIVGDYVKVAGQIFRVLVITDNTSLTLDSNYIGPSGSGFIAHRDFRVSAGTQNITSNNLTYAISFTVDNVNRDGCGTGSITADTFTSCPGGIGVLVGVKEDPSTQKVTVKVAWTQDGNAANVLMSEYLTRSKNEVNKFTDWSGAPVEGPLSQPGNSYSSKSADIDNSSGSIKITAPALSGWLISSTFDTGYTGGVAFNSIMWKGSFGTGVNTVNFQLATSNCSNGASDPPACAVGGWTSYIGPDNTSLSSYITTSPGVPMPIVTVQHNNKRYYRYKIDLGTDNTSPIVEDVIVNWSP